MDNKKLNDKGTILLLGITISLVFGILITSIATLYYQRMNQARKEANKIQEQLDIDMMVHNFFYYVEKGDGDLGNGLLLVWDSSASYEVNYSIYENDEIKYKIKTKTGQYTSYVTMTIEGKYYKATYKYIIKRKYISISYKVFEEIRG